jgi:transformation/transcription domain-associated protein
MLAAMADCRPMPVLPPALVTALAAQHHAWPAAAAVLEHQALVAGRPAERLAWVRCLAQLYGELGETDRLRALQQRTCAARESHVALSLDAYGHAADAQRLYLELMAQEESAGGGVGLKLSSFELELWEQRWVAAAKELGQWLVLADLAKANRQPALALDAAAQTHDWASVRDLLKVPSCIAALELGSPRHKLFEIYVAIVDGKFLDVEHHCNQCIQLALHQWATLPPLATGDGAHLGLLRLFHQLVEVHESGQIMLEVSQHARAGLAPAHAAAAANQQPTALAAPDFSHVIHTWRHRLPNPWDSIPEWDALLSWRQWVFAATADAFAKAASAHLLPPSALSGGDGAGSLLHDLPWTVLTKARAARKLQLEPVALETLATLYATPTLDVADAYTKLREQILMCHPKSASGGSTGAGGAAAARLQKLKGGLTLVNNTNLE